MDLDLITKPKEMQIQEHQAKIVSAAEKNAKRGSQSLEETKTSLKGRTAKPISKRQPMPVKTETAENSSADEIEVEVKGKRTKERSIEDII